MTTRKTEIALPVLRFEYSLTLEIPRFMTAFERTILMMVERFSRAGRFQEATIAGLFDKILGIGGVEAFVADALDELLSPGVAALATRNHDVPPASLRLEDLAVTEAGLKYLKSRRLGGETRTERRVAAYDLVTSTLLDGRVALSEGVLAGRRVDHSEFRQVAPPQDAVCAAALDASPKGTQVERVHLETPEPERLFRTVQATFGIKGGKPVLFAVRGVDHADTDRFRAFLDERLAGISVGDMFGDREDGHEPNRIASPISRFKPRRGQHIKTRMRK